MEGSTKTAWHRIERLYGKIYSRRKARVAGPCTFCTKPLVAGSLYWRRGHVRLHIECFEELQRQVNSEQRTVNSGGRPSVLDDEKERAIDKLLAIARANGYPANLAEIARAVNVSRTTVRRYIRGEYHPQTQTKAPSTLPVQS